jgi:hypothetical protein
MGTLKKDFLNTSVNVSSEVEPTPLYEGVELALINVNDRGQRGVFLVL